ncbi:hypothetical protein [Actinopolymorpha singaporensis]|uniref:hypothetical protein n=1 Tax=Actinopolymorpha singaporensis TaxID=117157 RepID=UPI0012FD3DEE|nr:hypothetical protein [Actinopolymorpha singaporensis]
MTRFSTSWQEWWPTGIAAGRSSSVRTWSAHWSSARSRSARCGRSRAIIVCRWLTPAGYLLLPLAGPGGTGLALLCVAQFVFGLSIGVDSPIENQILTYAKRS